MSSSSIQQNGEENSELEQSFQHELKILTTIKTTDNVEIEDDQLVYNPKNKLFTEKDCIDLFKRFNVKQKPHNIKLYQQAFVDASYTVKKNQTFEQGNTLCPEGCMPLWEANYERLEFIGDTIYNAAISHYIFERYENENEGFLSKLKNILIKGTTQAYISQQLNFDQYLIISSDFEKRNSRNNNTKLLKDVFEAFIGAMFLDLNMKPALNLEAKGYYPFQGFGFQIVQKFIISICEEYIDIGKLLIDEHDYVDEFVKIYKSKNKNFGNPQFKYQGKEKINNADCHKYVVRDKDRVLAYGYGKTEKEAKRNCARKALEVYQ